MAEHAEIAIRLAGPVRVRRLVDGADLTPRSAKATGLLVLLGTAPELRRARAWLQDRLWSDRGAEHGAASLRQALSEVRRTLGGSRDCLVTDGAWVGLDPRRVTVRLDPAPEDFGFDGEPPEFAEGLDVRDPEFEDWIRDQRAAYASGIATAASPVPRPSPPPLRPASPPRRSRTRIVGLMLLLALALGVGALWVGLRDGNDGAPVDRAFANAIPSIAVLPFHSLGGDAAQQALVTGITRDIITDLSKLGGLLVLGADTSFRLAGIDLPTARPDGPTARYALSGSVQWLDSGQVRLNVQLMETELGRVAWAERFDRRGDDLLKLQNEVVRHVVDVIGPVSAGQGRLLRVELDRIARSPTEDLRAFDHYLQGVQFFDAGETLPAREAFARATEQDPGYARAYAMETWTYLSEVWDGSASDPAASLVQAEALAERALAADPNEAYAHWALGAVRLFQRRHDEAIAAYRHALDLNPNGQDLLIYFGWALTYAGEPDEGLAFMQQAIERNPYHPGWYLWDVAWGHFVAHRYRECLDVLEQRRPRTIGTRELLALCYAMLGHRGDAEREIGVVLAERPGFTVEGATAREPFARPEDLQHYARALRAAGVPERPGG